MCNILFVLSLCLRILQYFVSITKIGSKTLKDQLMEQRNNKKTEHETDIQCGPSMLLQVFLCDIIDGPHCKFLSPHNHFIQFL